MEMMLFFLIFFLLLPFLMGSFLSFDEIIKIQYSDFKSEWEADGRPSGFSRAPKDIKLYQSSDSRIRLNFIWLFKTPDWAKDNKTTKKHFTHLRSFVLCWNVGIVLNIIFSSNK